MKTRIHVPKEIATCMAPGEIEIRRVGISLVINPSGESRHEFFAGLRMTVDFMNFREQPSIGEPAVVE